MPFLAVDRNGQELKSDERLERGAEKWVMSEIGDYVELKKGSIFALIGRELTWEDEPVEISEPQPNNKDVAEIASASIKALEEARDAIRGDKHGWQVLALSNIENTLVALSGLMKTNYSG